MEQDLLFSNIDTFLRECRCAETPPEQSLAYWTARPHITRAEIEMLDTLGQEPHDVAAFAHHLGRDIPSTQHFLAALVAIGILECRGACYITSAAARLYCHTFLHGSSELG
jgi:hypothetical protein